MGFPRWGRFTNDKLSPSGKFRTRNGILRIAASVVCGLSATDNWVNEILR
jgi:hypothetical protein